MVELPVIGEWVLALAAGAIYFSFSRRAPAHNVTRMRQVFIAAVAVIFGVAALSTFLQYSVWKADQFSQNFLPPHQSILYFAKYAGTHFWLTPVLSLVIAGAFFLFLHVLARKNERFFEEGEIELGALAALLAGWPGFVIFLPAVFLAVVVISGAKLMLQKSAYTTLGLPLLVGLFVALVWGDATLRLVGLGLLAVIPGAR